MKIKLDENLDVRLADLFVKVGHDVSTVHEQGLGGQPDQRIFDVCHNEKRILISQDMDFSNVLRFPPDKAYGIVVIKSRDQLLPTTRRLLRAVLALLDDESPAGALWIVEDRRIRIYPAKDRAL
jgi:predicted nuclease of predicted toxin-antitoxin system